MKGKKLNLRNNRKELDFLITFVKEAEQISKKDFQVHSKGDKSDLVTNLDLEIEKFLIDRIGEQYPDFDIVSEEYNTNGKVTENCFIIDPIDGTINFANGLPLWGIQICCRKGGETVASVIDLPAFHELYYADETGAYLNGSKIRVREVPVKNALYSILGRGSLPETRNMLRYSPNFRNLGAACVTMAFLAGGRIHGVSFRADSPWDYEPGLFLCKMAGAVTKNEPGFHAAAMNREFLDILEKESASGGRPIQEKGEQL